MCINYAELLTLSEAAFYIVGDENLSQNIRRRVGAVGAGKLFETFATK
jgi:hypothetical protein